MNKTNIKVKEIDRCTERIESTETASTKGNKDGNIMDGYKQEMECYKN